MGSNNNLKKIKYPYHSAELAEFVGIAMGDGGLSQYQLTISLHHYDDRDYIGFVASIIEKLFGIQPGIYYRKERSVKNITISSRAVVSFFNNHMNFQIGNKIRQRIDVPAWIKENPNFAIACMRGLFDTDGSVVIHKYCVGGKQYCYKKLEFSSMSAPLRQSVCEILSTVRLNPREAKGSSIWIDSKANVKAYFDIIGTHNTKHWKRYNMVL